MPAADPTLFSAVPRTSPAPVAREDGFTARTNRAPVTKSVSQNDKVTKSVKLVDTMELLRQGSVLLRQAYKSSRNKEKGEKEQRYAAMRWSTVAERIVEVGRRPLPTSDSGVVDALVLSQAAQRLAKLVQEWHDDAERRESTKSTGSNST